MAVIAFEQHVIISLWCERAVFIGDKRVRPKDLTLTWKLTSFKDKVYGKFEKLQLNFFQ